MKITKLPDKCEPNKLLKEKIKNMYMTCPCCGENRECDIFDDIKNNRKHIGVECYSFYPARYGIQKPWHKHLFDKRTWWTTMIFECHTCGAKWESEEFPEIECELYR